jgi:hypothetical protein
MFIIIIIMFLVLCKEVLGCRKYYTCINVTTYLFVNKDTQTHSFSPDRWEKKHDFIKFYFEFYWLNHLKS